MSTRSTVYCKDGIHLLHDMEESQLYLEYSEGPFTVTLELPTVLAEAFERGLQVIAEEEKAK